MSGPETYEVFAIRYASKTDRTRGENFIIADPHDAPMPIDFYVWAIRNENRTIVVDTGFDHAEAANRQRKLSRLPREGLETIGIDAAKVETVVITHLHYDHAGTLDDFPAATFHLQEKEMRYATGRHMCQAQPFQFAYTAEHVCAMVRRLFDGRVAFHDGASELAPGDIPAPDRRPYHGRAVRQGADQPGLGGAGLGRQPFLREHGGGGAIPDRLFGGGYGRRLSGHG